MRHFLVCMGLGNQLQNLGHYLARSTAMPVSTRPAADSSGAANRRELTNNQRVNLNHPKDGVPQRDQAKGQLAKCTTPHTTALPNAKEADGQQRLHDDKDHLSKGEGGRM